MIDLFTIQDSTPTLNLRKSKQIGRRNGKKTTPVINSGSLALDLQVHVQVIIQSLQECKYTEQTRKKTVVKDNWACGQLISCPSSSR